MLQWCATADTCTTRKALADNPYCGKRVSVFGPRIHFFGKRNRNAEYAIRCVIPRLQSVIYLKYVVCIDTSQLQLQDILSVVSRLVEYMILVPSHTLPSEHRWEAETFRHLILIDALVTSFCLANDEFTHL